MFSKFLTAFGAGIAVMALGCGGDAAATRTNASNQSTAPPPATTSAGDKSSSTSSKSVAPSANAPTDEVAEARAKLSKEDLALVEAQEWCAVNNEGRLGTMGVPLKLTIKGKPVFLCCSGCKRKAEADPDKTLAKVEELKRKKASELHKG